MLTRQRILSEEMVWNEFSWEVVRYYAAVRDEIVRLRKASHDRTLYSEFEWLYECLIDIDCKKRRVGSEVASPNDTEVTEFIKEESELVP